MKKLMFLILVLALSCFVRAEIVNGIPAENLLAWYDANDINVVAYVDENNVITTWPNRVAGGSDLITQSGTVYYEASNAIFNNRACVNNLTGTGIMRADGIVDMLDGKTFTIFTVVDTQYVGFTNGGGGSRFYGRGHLFTVGDPTITATPPTRINVPAVRVYKLAADYDQESGTYSNGYIQMILNNDSGNTATASTVSQGSVITFGNGYFQIPYTGNYGRYAEIIIYDRALNNDEENAVGYYLANKYNIATSFSQPSIYTLDLSVSPSFIDTVSPAAGLHSYLVNEVIDLSAMVYNACPQIYQFSSWTGDVASSTSAQTTILMDGNKTVTANYSLSSSQCVKVTIQTSPAGLATITPSEGTYDYVVGEVIDIQAQPEYINCPAVYAFSNWSGSGIDDPSSASTTLTVGSSQTITAIYNDARACGDVCHPYPALDINNDCLVDLTDFAAFVQEWMECTSPACD